MLQGWGSVQHQARQGSGRQARGPGPVCVCSWLRPVGMWPLPELSVSAPGPPAPWTSLGPISRLFLLHFRCARCSASPCGSRKQSRSCARASAGQWPGICWAVAALHLPSCFL